MSGVGYVVLAHRGPEQLRELLQVLAPGPVWLHVDARVSEDLVAQMVPHGAAHVHLLPRFASRWATFGLVDAELGGLRQALASGVGHVVVMSGQDAPLTSHARIQSFLEKFPGVSFFARFPVPVSFWERGGGMKRFAHRNWAYKKQRLRLPIPRRIPAGVSLWGGSQYKVLAREHVAAILDVHERRPELARFWQRVWIPDESFIPTVLMSTVDHGAVIDENLWFIQKNVPGAKHPDLLDLSSLPALLQSVVQGSAQGGSARTKLFTRKVDLLEDDGLTSELFRRAGDGAGAPTPRSS